MIAKNQQLVKTEIIYVGKNVNQWSVKDYIVSEQCGDWLCTCAIKYKRNPNFNCKHIDLVQNFLLNDKEKARLQVRIETRKLIEKLKEIEKKKCAKHNFTLVKAKGKISYYCFRCKSELEVSEYKLYRKTHNMN